jgi:general secretion pathway protein K
MAGADQKGVALLVVLTIMAVLVATTLELNRRIRSRTVYAAQYRNHLQAQQMGASGIAAAMALLVEDKAFSQVDSIQEAWADPQQLETLVQSLDFADGQLTLKIEDEMGKIQINALLNYPEGRKVNPAQYLMWYRFLSRLAAWQQIEAEVDPDEWLDALRDWLDRGDDDAVSGFGGAENPYYQNLDPPYTISNGPMSSSAEMTFIKGMDRLLEQAPQLRTRWQEYFSVYGAQKKGQRFTFPGKININTAPVPVLAALLPTGYETLALGLDAYRQAKADGSYVHPLNRADWYREVPGAEEITIDPQLIDVSSEFFRITATVKLDNIQMQQVAVIQRRQETQTQQWWCKVLHWQTQ